MKLSEIDCRKVCYAQLIGHCNHHSLECATKQEQYIHDLSDKDKLVLEAIIGEQEEFDDGTGANELLAVYLNGQAKVTISYVTYTDNEGKTHHEHVVNCLPVED